MANPRLSKPVYFYETALNLVMYIECASEDHAINEELRKTLESARSEYTKDTESWSLKSWIYYIARTRAPEIDIMIQQLTPVVDANSDKLTLANSPIDIIIEFLDKENAGWEVSSANTKVLQLLLQNLPRYNHEVGIKPEDYQEFKDILIIANEVRKKMIADFVATEKERVRVEEDLRVKKEERNDQYNRLRELEIQLAEKDKLLTEVQAKNLLAEAQILALTTQSQNALSITPDKKLIELLHKLQPNQLKELESTLKAAAMTYTAEATGLVKRKDDLVATGGMGIVSKMRDKIATGTFVPPVVAATKIEASVTEILQNEENKANREEIKLTLNQLFERKFGNLDPRLIKKGNVVSLEQNLGDAMIQSYISKPEEPNEAFKKNRLMLSKLFTPRVPPIVKSEESAQSRVAKPQ